MKKEKKKEKKNKSRNFTVFLLKDGITPDVALKEDHGLEEICDATDLPEGSKLYIANNLGKKPWWTGYFGVEKELYQVQQGALVFLWVDTRWMVLSFGMSYHKLKDTCYEYNFGLITTLNMLDPEKIKSADIMFPEDAKRQRIQSPIATKLNLFDIRHDESIMRSLTGAVKEEYQTLFKNVTGYTNLKVTLKVQSDELNDFCKTLLNVYTKEDYRVTFPEVDNISPVKDPAIINALDDELQKAFKAAPIELVLTIPEIIDYNQSYKISYAGGGRSTLEFDDVYIAGYREYLVEKELDDIIDINAFKKHSLLVLDENNQHQKNYSIYKCFLFECVYNGTTYHLNEGEWYEIKANFIEKLATELDPIFLKEHEFMSECTSKKEADYNDGISKKNTNVICLDQTNISPKGQYNIEPCDLIAINEKGILELMHVKISTRSANLSHLFNQGANSMEALRLIEESRVKLKELVKTNLQMIRLIDESKYAVTFGIITAKIDKKSNALPIFSRISLYRIVKAFKLMGITCAVFLVEDQVDRKIKKDTRKKAA